MILRDLVRRSLASGLLLLGFAIAATAGAAVRELAPGDAARAGEALLVVALDADAPLEEVRIDGPGHVVVAAGRGATHRLFAVPPGEYRYATLRLAGARHDVGVAPAAAEAFVAETARINYPGTLVVRVDDPDAPRMHRVNHGLVVIDWLDATHARLAAAQPLRWAGRDADPFPAFYAAAHAAAGSPAAAAPAPAPAATGLPAHARALWTPSRLRAATVNARGDLVARTAVDGTTWKLALDDVAGGTSQVIATGGAPIASIAWSDDRDLVVSRVDGGAHRVAVLHLTRDGAQWTADERVVPRPGSLVDALPADARHVLFASTGRDGELLVHRIDVSSQAALDAERFDPAERLNAGAEADLAWFTDARGELRVALAARDDRRVLLHGAAGRFAPVLELAGDDFVPSAVSADGDFIYALTDRDRGQRDLVAFDPATGRVAKTLFSRANVDVAAPLFDAQRRLVGVAFWRDGRLASEWFDAANRRNGARLAAHFPGDSVNVLDRDASGRTLVVGVDGSDHPPALYLYDTARDTVRLLDRGLPALDGAPLAGSTVVRATSADGLPLQGILTLPREARAGTPLVVLPHGGPVGVSDKRQFDPEVQFIASLGYAVLQVNYRGSEHRGRAFREAGYGQYGAAIEDDVDAVVDAALAAHPLSRERICSVGTSYGGYSSLIGAVRRPHRYRCVASISGFTDRDLFWTASDTARSDEGRALLASLMGTDGAANVALSPVYRYADLKTPVLLAHGTEDVRVDAEHARRLARMLGLAGRPPVVVEVPGAGHTIEDPAQRAALWARIGAFLRQHLG